MCGRNSVLWFALAVGLTEGKMKDLVERLKKHVANGVMSQEAAAEMILAALFLDCKMPYEWMDALHKVSVFVDSSK